MKTTTTHKINKIIDGYLKGHGLKRADKIFYRNQVCTLDANISVALTPDELIEYVKCANDIVYFIEKYCTITQGIEYTSNLELKPTSKLFHQLRGYQKEWIDDFVKNRFLIYCTSRQTGYSQVMSGVYLHYLIFNNKDKNVLLMANKGDTAREFIDKVWDRYLVLPYFLKPGIVTKTQKLIYFNNGNKMVAQATTKTTPIDFETIDILSYMEFSHIPPSILDTHYNNAITKISTRANSKVIIQSQPNGHNKFTELIINSERKPNDPLKNMYKTIKTYWWEVPGRDEKWKWEEIRNLGSLEYFNQEYDLQVFAWRKA